MCKETLAGIVILICLVGMACLGVAMIGQPKDNATQYAEAVELLISEPSLMVGNSSGKFKISVPGIIKNYSAEVDEASTSDRGRRTQIIINGRLIEYPTTGDPALSCILIRAKYCNDLSHEIPVQRGDVISISDRDAGFFDSAIHWQVEFIPEGAKSMFATPTPIDLQNNKAHCYIDHEGSKCVNDKGELISKVYNPTPRMSPYHD